MTEQEIQIITRIKNEPQLAVEDIHPVLASLARRGYIKIFPAKTLLGSATGLYMFEVAETGSAGKKLS